MIRLAAFLGNPGTTYARTRHNAGWMVAERIASELALEWRGKFKGRVATRSGVAFLMPETLMNRSGESVAACAAFYGVESAGILVVHDDIELEFGRVELKQGGGLGGHNGLKDIARALGSREFSRVRIGVSRPLRGDVAAYVLSRFSAEQEVELPRVIESAVAHVMRAIAQD